MALFGTDGIRAHLSSSVFQEQEFKQVIHKIAQWILSRQTDPTLLIGHDTRPSAPKLKKWMKEVLSSYPCTIYDADIIPTPFVCTLVHTQKIAPFTCGIILTASHNNADYNGIKLYTPDGKLSDEEEQNIENFTVTPKQSSVNTATWHSLSEQEIITEYQKCIEQHMLPIKKNNVIVIDCAHGALSGYAEKLLSPYGSIVSLSSSHDGQHINKKCGAVHPEHLQEAVKKHNATIGFAFDGDGDRIVAVDHAGTIYDGDDILFLLSHHTSYKQETTFVGTQMSNEGLAQTFSSNDQQFIRTPVGDKHVIKHLQKTNSKLGAEPSGHIVCNDIGPWADGLSSCIRILETLSDLNTWPSYKKFASSSFSIPFNSSHAFTEIELNSVRTKALKLIPYGRCVLRKSGTEPVIRVRIEDQNIESIKKVSDYIKKCMYTIMQGS